MKHRAGNTHYEVLWNERKIIAGIGDKLDDVAKNVSYKIEKDAKQNCPVGIVDRQARTKYWQERRPGALRDSIQRRKSKFEDGGWIVTVGSKKVFYASFVELGHKSKGGKPVPPQPFLRNALKENNRYAQREAFDRLKQYLK